MQKVLRKILKWTAPRRLLVAVLALIAGLAVTTASIAQEYKGTITLVVGYPAGGSADVAARILADKLQTILGQPVVVDNRGGAGGQIAARFVKSAPADGSVLFFTNGHTVVTVPHILKEPGFNTATDFRPISEFARFEMVLVANPKTRSNTLKDLTGYFANSPADRSVAVPAPGSAPEFIAGRLSQLLHLDLQAVAYRGSAPATADLLGGQVPAAVLPVADVIQYIKAGKLRAIALTHATPLLPGVPTFAQLNYAELGVGEFLAVYAPAGMNDANARRFNAAIRKAAAMPDVVERVEGYAMQPGAGSPQELAVTFSESNTAVQALMKAVDYKPQ